MLPGNKLVIFVVVCSCYSYNKLSADDPSLPQLNLPSPNEICPCLNTGQGNLSCPSYDPAYAAVTLEEVLHNFVDTRTIDPRSAHNVYGATPVFRGHHGRHAKVHDAATQFSRKSAKFCDSEQCWTCLGHLSRKLLGYDDSRVKAMMEPFGVDHMALNESCGSLKMHKKRHRTKNVPSRMKNDCKTKRNANARDSDESDECERKTRRLRRFAPNDNGSSTPLACDYRRGDTIDGNDNYVGLCNTCWSIRTLPDHYSPRFLNEKNCDQSDVGCMSGYGACRPVFRSVDVLFNAGTTDKPSWTQYTLNSPVSCECQVQFGSVLHDFVKK